MLRAPDPQATARSTTLILLVCGAVVGGLTLTTEADARPFVVAVHWLGVAALLAGAVVCTVLSPERYDRLGLGIVAALGGVALVCTLNLLTEDTSAAAQAFFAFPVLWAASHLRSAAVVLVTATTLVAHSGSLFLLLPPAAALTDAVFFGAVLVVMAVMLVRAGRTQERLVQALQEQVTVDALKGLASRRAFDVTLEAALGRSVAGGTALVLIDVDSFKSINDTHGHPVGAADRALYDAKRSVRGRVAVAYA